MSISPKPLHPDQDSRVLAYCDDGCWNPATILDRSDGGVTIQLDNGERGWTHFDNISPVNIETFDMVEYQTDASDDFITGFVVDQRDNQYLIQLEDRSREWVSITKLRVVRDAPILADTARRFDLLVIKTQTCWWWPQYEKQSSTYQPYSTYSSIDGHATHRLAYRLSNGRAHIPNYYLVRHRCGNPGCVNPGHLILGEAWENSLDEVVRRRHNRRPGDIFTYEDDLEMLITEFEARIDNAGTDLRQKLEHQLSIMYSRRGNSE